MDIYINRKDIETNSNKRIYSLLLDDAIRLNKTDIFRDSNIRETKIHIENKSYNLLDLVISSDKIIIPISKRSEVLVKTDVSTVLIKFNSKRRLFTNNKLNKELNEDKLYVVI